MPAFLYGAKATTLTQSNLYLIDSTSPGTPTTIGPIGMSVTGMAFDPTSGTLYGVTGSNSNPHPHALITINTSTGAGTFIGDTGLNSVGDIGINAAGNIYGFSGVSDALLSINKSTGVATPIGSGFGRYGNGTAFDSADTLWTSNHGVCSSCALQTVTTGGVVLTSVNFSGNPSSNPANGAISGMDFDAADVLYAVINGNKVAGQYFLVTVNTATGAITNLGNLPDFFDGLVVSPIAATTITLTPICGAVGATISVDGTGFDPSESLTATFNGSPLTLGGTTTTNGSGNFTGATFVVPNLPFGAYTVHFATSTKHADATFTIPVANHSCATALTLTDCVNSSTACVTSTGPDPLNGLLGTGGGHAVWFKWTAPALAPAGATICFTFVAGSPAIGKVNAAILHGGCGAQTISTQPTSGTSVTLAQTARPFTGRTVSSTRMMSGAAAPAAPLPSSVGAYAQNQALPFTLCDLVHSGETIYIEIDNYDGSAQGVFEVCVDEIDVGEVFTFRNYWRAEQ